MSDTRSTEINAVRSRARYAFARDRAQDVLGGKCVRCGFNDRRALQFDHIEGGGVQEMGWTLNLHGKLSPRRRTVLKYLEDIAAGRRPDIQLLCANCNWIKRTENNENRRKAAA